MGSTSFRQVMAGADLVAVQKNRYWQLTLDAGPFVAALEYATGKDAVIVGKPAAAFFDAAARLLGLPRSEMLMVGDDVGSDVGGAVEAGMLAALGQDREVSPRRSDAWRRGACRHRLGGRPSPVVEDQRGVIRFVPTTIPYRESRSRTPA